jgi:hypothetical protein
LGVVERDVKLEASISDTRRPAIAWPTRSASRATPARQGRDAF